MPPYLPFHAYSVAALTPSSRATSAVLRPPSICLTAAILFSSLCRLFFIFVLLSKLDNSNYGWLSLSGAGQWHGGHRFHILFARAAGDGVGQFIEQDVR